MSTGYLSICPSIYDRKVLPVVSNCFEGSSTVFLHTLWLFVPSCIFNLIFNMFLSSCPRVIYLLCSLVAYNLELSLEAKYWYDPWWIFQRKGSSLFRQSILHTRRVEYQQCLKYCKGQIVSHLVWPNGLRMFASECCIVNAMI